jgi:hypothetical protein
LTAFIRSGLSVVLVVVVVIPLLVGVPDEEGVFCLAADLEGFAGGAVGAAEADALGEGLEAGEVLGRGVIISWTCAVSRLGSQVASLAVTPLK